MIACNQSRLVSCIERSQESDGAELPMPGHSLGYQREDRLHNRDAYEYVQTQRARQRHEEGLVGWAHEGGTMHACMYVVLCLTASNATRPPSVHGSRSRALISSPLPSHTPKLELHACMLSSVLFCSFGRLPNPGGGRKEEHFAGVRG